MQDVKNRAIWNRTKVTWHQQVTLWLVELITIIINRLIWRRGEITSIGNSRYARSRDKYGKNDLEIVVEEDKLSEHQRAESYAANSNMTTGTIGVTTKVYE